MVHAGCISFWWMTSNKIHKTNRRRGRSVTPEEQALWQAFIRTVKPLPGRRVAGDPPAAPRDPAAVGQPTSAVPIPPRPAASPPLPDLDPGATVGLDRATAQKLLRGRMPIEGRLDLHGMSRAQAHGALNRFIEGSAARGRRCVLVITGKGDGAGTTGVLRRETPMWLNGARLRGLILAFGPARPRDGGEGALYVLLKRRR